MRCPNFYSPALVALAQKFDRCNSAASLHLSPTAFGGFPLAGASVSNPLDNKIKKPSKMALLFWRRRRDLNPRASCPTYTLSRGASSPLEYFSIR